jgi:hypothetical protein
LAFPVSRVWCLTLVMTALAAAQAAAGSVSIGGQSADSRPNQQITSENRSGGIASAACTLIQAPPSRISTASKYDQEITTRSVLDDSAAQARQRILMPISQSMRQLSTLAGVSGSGAPVSAECARENVLRFARSGSFTDMASEDAYLSRDRFVTDIGIVLMALQQQGKDLSQSVDVRNWLTSIGDQTMAFYDWQAGPMSQNNNHRYWAGLSVGMIGYFLHDARMVSWAKQSFEIGVHQIDGRGLLPLEMTRGSKAFEYHVYAYRALAGFDALAKANGDAMSDECESRLALLESRIRIGLADPSTFEGESGYRQDAPAREGAFLKPLLISTLLQHQDRATY